MVKKIKLESNNKNTFYYPDHREYSEEERWEKLLIETIKKGHYLGALLMLQDKLRNQVKNNQEDKRTEGIN